MRGVCSVLAALAIVGGSCATPTRPDAAARPTSVVTARPSAVTVPVGYVPYVSSASPYRACHPRSHQPRFGWIPVDHVRGDAFVGGRPGRLPEAISILAERAAGYDTTRYLSDVLANLRGAGRGVEVLGETTVDGVGAQRLRFSLLTATNQRYTVQQVVWATADLGWVASVSSLPADAERVAEILATMLSCFRSDR